MAIANIKNIDDEKYNKALFVIKSKLKNLIKLIVNRRQIKWKTKK